MFQKDCTVILIHAFFFCLSPFLFSSPLALWCMLDPGLLQDQFPDFYIPWNYSATSNTNFNFFLVPITILLLLFSLFGLCWNIHLVYLSLRFLNIWFFLWGGIISLMPNPQPGKPRYSI